MRAKGMNGILARTGSVPLGIVLCVFALAPSSLGSETFTVRSHLGENATVRWPEAELAKAFETYWAAFARRNVEACLSMEAPHFRFLVQRSQYAHYIEIVTKGDIKGLEILEPVLRTPFFVEVPMWVLKSSSSGEVLRIGMKDRWVKIQGRWFHLIRDPLAFPGV